MIPKDCKRLAEVGFAIAVVSKRSAKAWPATWQVRLGETEPKLQEPIKDPARFPWHEVTRVQHYWLEVNTMTRPMQVREDSPDYGTHRRDAEDAEAGTYD